MKSRANQFIRFGAHWEEAIRNLVAKVTVPVICCALLFTVAQTLCAGTVAYYRFEEGAAGALASGTNSILDSSGNGLDGTPYGTLVYSSNVAFTPIPLTGASNKLSASFNGYNSRVFIADNPLFILTNSLTIEAMVFPMTRGSTYAGSQIFFRGDDRSGFDPYTLAVIPPTNLQFNIQDTNNNVVTLVAPLSPNMWHHVAGTLDGSTGNMSLYIDGMLVAGTNTTMRPLGVLTGPNPGLGIGNVQSANYSEYFYGLIDEVRLSDQALGPNQFLIQAPPIQNLLGIGNFNGQLALYWPSWAANYTLQTSLDMTNWVNLTNGSPLVGVTVSNAHSHAHFRLVPPP